MAAKNFHEVFAKFVQSQKLKGTFAESIYRGYNLIESHKLVTKDSQVLLSMKISEDLININGTIHGGALATILDTSTTLAILKADRNLRKSVSAELNFSFMSPGKLNETIFILAECDKIGKALAFSNAHVYGEDQTRLIGGGRHIKAMLDQPFDF